METQIHGLLLCDDLIFTSRVTGTARDLGFSFKTARSADGLRELLLRHWPACIILDLSNPNLIIADFLTELRERGDATPRVIAYGSHVDAATPQVARTAGCDEVLTRSQFVEELPRKLPEWVNERDGPHPKGAR
jgi:DNA-binding response OmpR family regulator